MDYKIIDRSPEIESIIRGIGKWRRLFDPLPENKAIEMHFDTKLAALKSQRLIQATLRPNRNVGYKVHCRTIPDGTGYILYVWKEMRT